MKFKKCFECGFNDANETLNGRCDKCHEFNEEVKADTAWSNVKITLFGDTVSGIPKITYVRNKEKDNETSRA